MNFKPELAAKVMAGEKTVTRRVANGNVNSPWCAFGCSLKAGRDYAVCPGRGKHAIGRVVVTDVRLEPLGHLDDDEARREGFANAVEFEETFAAINGGYDPDVKVWRIEFEPERVVVLVDREHRDGRYPHLSGRKRAEAIRESNQRAGGDYYGG